MYQGEYRLGHQGVAISFYRIMLPVRRSYPRIGGVIAATIDDFPLVALDALRFKRERISDTPDRGADPADPVFQGKIGTFRKV